VAKITREAPAAHKPPPGLKAPPGDAGVAMMAGPPTGVAWSTEGGTVALAFGAEPLVTFKTSARPEKKLRDDPLVARFTTNVGASASTFLVVQPLRYDPKRAHLAAAPVAAAVSRKDGDAVIRLEVSDALLREVSRYFGGF